MVVRVKYAILVQAVGDKFAKAAGGEEGLRPAPHTVIWELEHGNVKFAVLEKEMDLVHAVGFWEVYKALKKPDIVERVLEACFLVTLVRSEDEHPIDWFMTGS